MSLHLEPILLLGYLIASVLGLVMLGSVYPAHLPQQSIMLVLGLILMLYFSSQEVDVYKSFAPVAYGVSILLLLITFFFAHATRGAHSWIDLGEFRAQPSEFVKPLLILSFAYILERFPPNTLKNILLNTIVFLVPFLLIFFQPDLGTATIIGLIWITQLFIAGLPWIIVIFSPIVLLIVTPILPHLLHSYQFARLTTFLDPFQDPLGSGYNVIQSMIAVGSGGIIGKGLGHGTQSHLHFLPERHTDFAFASLAEELGLVGAISIIAVIGIFVFRLLHYATTSQNKGNRLILGGCVAYFLFQSFINIAMNLGIAPVTGITLPLISYGGSSVIATGVILGIAVSAAVSHSTRLLEIR